MNAFVPPAPPPRLVTGGTGAREVSRLRRVLAEVLAAEGPAASAGTGAPRAPRSPVVPIGPAEDPVAVRADLARRLSHVPEGADLLLRTSGSTTGTGALVAMSGRALTASARATHARLGGPGTWVLALPSHHVAGLQVLVRSLMAGTSPVVVDIAGGFDPGALAAGIDLALEDRRSRGRVYTSLVPTQLRRCLADGLATAALARARAVLVGGAAADPGLLQRAREAGVRVVTTYGMSETGGGCVYDGVPLDGVAVRIEEADADGAGRIVLAGPVLAEGYATGPRAGGGAPAPGEGDCQPPPAPSSFFRTDPHELVTADRGRIEGRPDGSRRLVVLGRLDDLIVTGGIKVDPHEVERVLTGVPGVTEVCVVGVPDDTWGSAVAAAIVPERGRGLDAGRVRALARELLGGVRAPKRVLIVDALPLRGPGKVDRRAVTALFAEGAPRGSVPGGRPRR